MNAREASTMGGVNRRRSMLVRLGLWVVALLLLWWAGRGLDLITIWQALRRLSILQLAILTIVNLVVLLTLSGRWWVVLRGLGQHVSYVKLSAYRLAAFGLSYFTPGPQFGGEPLQVYLLKSRHDVPLMTGTVSVTLEKAIELVGNFTFLLIGLVIIARLEFFEGRAGVGLLLLTLLLLALPLALLLVIAQGKRPLSSLMVRMPDGIKDRLASWNRWQGGVLSIEVEMTVFFRERPMALIGAMGFSFLTWILLVAEYFLMLRFLDLSLRLDETIAVLTTARLAFLTPLPGGLGALEAGQAFAFQRLGFSLAEGISVGLLIRARDVVFGAVGLMLGSVFVGARIRERG